MRVAGDVRAVTDGAGRWVTIAAFVVAVIALAAIGTGWWHLTSSTVGLSIESQRVGEVPVTIYRQAAAGPAPVVVIAHGFAGSQQMMQPYAVTLARNGYIAVTFDFPGHGSNPQPFVASLMDQERRIVLLQGALEQVAGFAVALPGGDGRLALLGHSMAGDILLRYAAAHRDQVAATVLLSPYMSPNCPRIDPRNVLFVFGELEPEMLHQAGREAVAAACTGQVSGAGAVEAGVTYGDPATGSARRLVLAPGVEHIGVLYGEGGIGAALEWLNRAFGWSGDGFRDARGRWLGRSSSAWSPSPGRCPGSCRGRPPGPWGRGSAGGACCRWRSCRPCSPRYFLGSCPATGCRSCSGTIWPYTSGFMGS
jgi:pimeloyl-ACP methyl ester carboxylesterase